MRIGKRELTMAITAAAMTLALAGCMAGNNDSAGTTSPTAGGSSTAAPGAGSDAGVGIPHLRIVHIAADGANVFFHGNRLLSS